MFRKGGFGVGCAANFDNRGAWIGDNASVYLFDGNLTPKRISNHGLEEKITASSRGQCYRFFFEGHEFLCVDIDQGTWAFDAATGQWCEFQSYGYDNWLPQCHAGGYFGARTGGYILQFGTGHADLDGVLERRFRGGFPLDAGGMRINNIRFRVNVGQTPNLSGNYADPAMEMRVSRDGGETWGNYRQRSIGAQGKYRRRAEFRALGLADDPGFFFEARCTDPVPFRISGVTINERGGGRSR